jgi:osomolarity two-component system sensor histidine kinase SLN1
MIARSPTSWPPSCSHSGTPISTDATATATSSTRWPSQDIPMSSSSTRREFPVKKPLEPLPLRSGRSLSLDEPDSDPEAPVLPPPAAAITTTYNRPKKTLRIDGGHGLRVYWSRFRRRLGAGTAPSTSSLVDSSAQGSNDGFRSDTQGGRQDEDEAEVDEVVVDRNWSDEIKSSVSLSEQDISLDRPGGHHVAGPNTDRDSVALHTGGFWGLSTLLFSGGVFSPPSSTFSLQGFPIKSRSSIMSRRIGSCVKCVAHWDLGHSYLPISHALFCILSSQPLALWSSLFLIINWVVNAATIPGPILLIDKIFVFGVRKCSQYHPYLSAHCALDCTCLHFPCPCTCHL